MGQPHKHRDVIIAWANGAEVQYRYDGTREWSTENSTCPEWFDDWEYRIKPKTVKREGWVNVYTAEECYAYATKEKADLWASDSRKACIHIEWEEEA